MVYLHIDQLRLCYIIIYSLSCDSKDQAKGKLQGTLQKSNVQEGRIHPPSLYITSGHINPMETSPE